MASTQFTIARHVFELDTERVPEAMDGILPEPIMSHWVVVSGRRYPPKQVLGELTGLDRADFTSHHARRVLSNLGFPVGRRVPSAVGGLTDRADSADVLAETLRAFAGNWVAVADDELLVAAPSPQGVVEWLAKHHRKADSMFRVPEDEVAATGLAPL